MLKVGQAYGTGKQYIGKNDFEMDRLLLGFTVGNQPNQTLQPYG